MRASAPIRICDAGGWTDTWFAERGLVVSVAVEPRAYATVARRARTDERPRVVIDAPDVGAVIGFDLDDPPGTHPLLEQSVLAVGVPDNATVDIAVECAAPPGASTGTSAAVTVALLGALDGALAGGRRTAAEIAALAHHVETERAGRQAGVQDQLASAHGGISQIEIDAYPHAVVTPLPLPPAWLARLQASIVTVFLGVSHVSSDVHRTVIAELEGEGPDAPRLERLRVCAADARDALVAQDLDAYAAALRRNTDAQAALHPGIVDATAQELIDLAQDAGAIGWKVNGAGGPGGSVVVLCPPDRPAVRRAIEEAVAGRPPWRQLPTTVTPTGLRLEPSGDAIEGRPEPPLA